MKVFVGTLRGATIDTINSRPYPNACACLYASLYKSRRSARSKLCRATSRWASALTLAARSAPRAPNNAPTATLQKRQWPRYSEQATPSRVASVRLRLSPAESRVRVAYLFSRDRISRALTGDLPLANPFSLREVSNLTFILCGILLMSDLQHGLTGPLNARPVYIEGCRVV